MPFPLGLSWVSQMLRDTFSEHPTCPPGRALTGPPGSRAWGLQPPRGTAAPQQSSKALGLSPPVFSHITGGPTRTVTWGSGIRGLIWFPKPAFEDERDSVMRKGPLKILLLVEFQILSFRKKWKFVEAFPLLLLFFF